jgi:transcriptional regulator with XRE-family HTH domain
MTKQKPTSIGTKIKRARIKAGLSRRKLMMKLRSAGVDVTETTIFNWENGVTTGPNAKELLVIIKALKIPLKFFCS